MPTFTKTVLGTQARGLAIGSLYQWAPNALTALVALTPTVIADLAVIDALSLSLYLNNDSGSVGNIDSFDVSVSDDDVNWTVVFTKTLKTPIVPGVKQKVCELAGWKEPYIRVRATSIAGAPNASVVILGSIFSSAQSLIISSEWDAMEKGFSRDVIWYNISPNTAVPVASEGIDVSNYDFVLMSIIPSAPPFNFRIWGKQKTTNEWGVVQNSDSTGNTLGITQRLKVSGLAQIYVQVYSGTATSKIGVIG